MSRQNSHRKAECLKLTRKMGKAKVSHTKKVRVDKNGNRELLYDPSICLCIGCFVAIICHIINNECLSEPVVTASAVNRYLVCVCVCLSLHAVLQKKISTRLIVYGFTVVFHN